MSFQYSSFQTSNLKSSLSSLIKPGHSHQCNLKNRSGLITPQLTDDFISLHKKEEKTKSKTFTEDFKLKTDDLCTQKIIQESTQIIVHCKPMMNSTASKTLMKDTEHLSSLRPRDHNMCCFLHRGFSPSRPTGAFRGNHHPYFYR